LKVGGRQGWSTSLLDCHLGSGFSAQTFWLPLLSLGHVNFRLNIPSPLKLNIFQSAFVNSPLKWSSTRCRCLKVSHTHKLLLLLLLPRAHTQCILETLLLHWQPSTAVSPSPLLQLRALSSLTQTLWPCLLSLPCYSNLAPNCLSRNSVLKKKKKKGQPHLDSETLRLFQRLPIAFKGKSTLSAVNMGTSTGLICCYIPYKFCFSNAGYCALSTNDSSSLPVWHMEPALPWWFLVLGSSSSLANKLEFSYSRALASSWCNDHQLGGHSASERLRACVHLRACVYLSLLTRCGSSLISFNLQDNGDLKQMK
jgi:hypothetical protein